MQEPRKLPTVTEVCKTLVITVVAICADFTLRSQLLIALTFAAAICKMLLQTVNLNRGIRNLFYFAREICTFSRIDAKFSHHSSSQKLRKSSHHILLNLMNIDRWFSSHEGYLFNNKAVKSRTVDCLLELRRKVP